MSQDDNTLAGSPSTESTSETDGGLSTDAAEKPAPVPAIDASIKEAEEGSAVMEEARAESGRSTGGGDVGFAPLEASTECDVETSSKLSEEYRRLIAECLFDLIKTNREIAAMRFATPSMKVAFERTASVETANRICRITEMEINSKGER